MEDGINKKIEDLKMIIGVEEQNYTIGLQNKLDFDTLREIKGNLRKLKNDLQVLLDQQA